MIKFLIGALTQHCRTKVINWREKLKLQQWYVKHLAFELELVLGLAWRKKKHTIYLNLVLFVFSLFVSLYRSDEFRLFQMIFIVYSYVVSLHHCSRLRVGWTPPIFGDLVLLLIFFCLLFCVVLLYHCPRLKGCWTAANMFNPISHG